MRRVLPLNACALICAALALPLPNEASAQSNPWVGRWGAPSCGRDKTEIVLSRSALGLSTFEAVCSVRSVRQRGEIFDIDASCRGEGGESRMSFSIQVSGNVLTFVAQRGIAFEPKRFQRCGAEAARGAEPPAGAAAASGATTSGLPLRRGYYVSDDTPCALASNATLSLLRSGGIGAGRELCEFRAIKMVNRARYEVVEHCGSDGRQAAIYEIRGPASYRRIGPNGSRYGARHCTQRELPAPWNATDIGDLIR